MAAYRVQQWSTFSRLWWVYDCKWQCPLKSARLIAKYLEGRHKPIYYPASQVGDHVVCINTKHIALEGELWRTFRIHHHTGYPGGFSSTRAFRMQDKDPTKFLRKIIYGNIDGTLLRRPMMERLHLFPEEEIPENILKNITGQIPQIMPIPKKLGEYTQEERDAFPKLFEMPKDYSPEDDTDYYFNK